jgi:hypothetical protein
MSLILQIWEGGGIEKSRMYNNTVYRESGTESKNQAPANLTQIINSRRRVATSSTLYTHRPAETYRFHLQGRRVSYPRKCNTKQHVRMVLTYYFNQLCFHGIRDMEFTEGGF